jgi:hypothetical protein
MSFGTYNRLLIPVLPQIIEMRHFLIEFLLQSFKHIIWICGPARMLKAFEKGPVFVPREYVSKLIVLILFEYLEKLSRKFDPRSFLIVFQ